MNTGATPTPASPLAGYRVIDMTTVLMGPLATQMLADYGADVVKVEPPEGDVMRHAGPLRHARMGPMYLNAGRNKRSIVLDIKQREGRQALLRLCAGAALFVHNVRPSAMARAGLAYEDLRAINPSIIHVSLVGYGSGGPYADQPAFDDIVQAGAGISTLFAMAGNGEPAFVPMVVADRLTGLTAAHACIAALLMRERTGKGQSVEVPMFETVAQMVLGDHAGGKAYVPPVGDAGYNRLLTPNRRPYRTRDGFIAAIPYNDKQFRAFFAAIGRGEEFDTNPLLSSQSARATSYHEVYGLLAGIFAQKTNAEWLALCKEHEVPCTPVRSLDELIDDPHLNAVGFFEESDHPSEGRVRQMRNSVRFSDADLSIRRHAPLVGEQSVEILTEIGCSPAEIADLLRSGASIDGRPAG